MENFTYPERVETAPLEHGAAFDLHRSELPSVTTTLASEALNAALSIDRARAFVTDPEGQIVGYDASRLAFGEQSAESEREPTIYDRMIAIGGFIESCRERQVLEEMIDE